MLFWILIGIGFVAGLLWAIAETRYYGMGFSIVGGPIAGAFFGGVAWFLVLAATTIITLPMDGELVSTDKQELTALSDSSSVVGRPIFLSGSYINETASFKYVVDYGDYSKLDSVNADNATIWEDNPEKPYIQTNYFAFDLGWLSPSGQWLAESVTTYEFHVPEGSIAGGYNVDVNN